MEGDTKIKSKLDTNNYQKIKNLSTNMSKYLKFYPEVYSSLYINNEPHKPNAWLAGVVDTGQTIYWDRLPGKMKLEVITEGGDQIFAETFNLEAGKSYIVDYSYGKSKFEISEKK